MLPLISPIFIPTPMFSPGISALLPNRFGVIKYIIVSQLP